MAAPALIALFVFLHTSTAEILTPPYFNLALGKTISATATCGDEGPELYCKLVGANLDHHDEQLIQGQVCDTCDLDTKQHPPQYAVDGMETWWQSPPLSRGMKYNEVNLTIDLGQIVSTRRVVHGIINRMTWDVLAEFHVAYVFVRMGNSPRPGLWALEKSTDYGKTFKPWQYFSDSPQDCERYFGKESLQPITRDDSVICSTEYSKIVPLEGGEIPISLLNYRPSANKYFNSTVLQEWTRATNVRLRLLRTKNLLGHLMSVARQDPTVTRRYFYSIKDISIGGRCMCNGHADNCDPADPESDTLVCRCQHNTCGPQCAQCCPGFKQKQWRISSHYDRFHCEPCNCHNHTTECTYEPLVDEQRLSLDVQGRLEGGGVCQNCQHNTEGINCNKCKPTYYRPYGKRWDEIDVCQPCRCDPAFSTGNCAEESGKCECRKEFNPPDCDSCAYGYYDYPECKPCICNLDGTDGFLCTPTGGQCPCKYNYAGESCEVCADGYYSRECKNCECNTVGAVSGVCDKVSGNCTCKSKYAGRTCDQCEPGYFSYPTCTQCNCDTSGTLASICDDVTGACICKEGFGGARCDQCIAGYYMEVLGRERVCVPCNCSAKGSTATTCVADGKCNCLTNFGGRQCAQCSPGYYSYPECLPCDCDTSGSIGSSCDDNGQCLCKPNFDGGKCDHCKEHFYNYPACEECNCDPKGVIASFAGCGSVPAGELCQCKDRVQGRICNDCKPTFWNLQDYNPLGCEPCNCHLPGTIGGLSACNTRTGQCSCKLHVGEKQCDSCQDGFYQLRQDSIFGCTECGCDIGGSIDNNCHKTSGQCRCNSRVEGRRCDRPIRAHYFPTLHQFQYEVEEGQTPSGAVRYKDADDVFPGYSWKGYVVFSALQNEVINSVHISKSSLYRMVLKYASPLKEPVVASIVITPESFVEIQQKFNVLLRPTSTPQLVTVAGDKGNVPAPLVMNPGHWTVTIKTTKEVMIDYFVLIPESYYEATVLTKLVDKPCVVGDDQLCRHFAYPSLAGYPVADVSGLVTGVKQYIDDPKQLNELNALASEIPVLSSDPPELQYNLKIAPNGNYVILVEYVTPVNSSAVNNQLDRPSNQTYDVGPSGLILARFGSGDGPTKDAILNFNECPYTFACRQVLVDELSKIFVANVHHANNVLYLEGDTSTLVGIKSIVAIPESQWNLDYITPRALCVRRDGQCAPAVFSAAVDSKKVELESGTGGEAETKLEGILDKSTAVVYLGAVNNTLTIDGKVPTPDDYMFVVHYYQPNHPASTVNVVVVTESQQYEGTLKVEHCPSNSGCRALVQSQGGLRLFPVNENFTLIFKDELGKGVWLDYVLVVASPDYVDTVLREGNVLDYTREFISKCAMNHYQVNANDTGFCRDSVFSITAEYNSGTLACLCDVEGSLDLECETFGGQCKCKPNVIGRTCSACHTGYYGFPNCQPCNCPSTAICNDYGECICPTNVEGENCDRCKPFTFNFDVQRGCDNCNCNPLGVVGNQLQCDANTGNCDCKENVKGRMCDHCDPGHYAFPECEECSCDRSGTTDEVCDQATSQCFCKKYVRGQACDVCKDEYFNLQAYDLDGCTKCFCFGKTTRCSSAYLYWNYISGMADWYLVNIEHNRTLNIFAHTEPPSALNETVIGADVLSGDGDTKVVYFGAPEQYLGKRLNSYGGLLRYDIFYTSGDTGSGYAIAAADVIIGGSNGFLLHNSIEQPASVLDWHHEVRMSEQEFTNLDGSVVTRDQFMNILVNVTAIYIRATYWHPAVTTRLIDVTLEIGIEMGEEGDQLASSVEQCNCPPQYQGLSCEQCAVGHYRLSTGPHAGLCVPCQCNGHADACDVNTGVCLNCKHDTMGDHCEQCILGYHGNATQGRHSDCQICKCPMPYPSNNFALGCDLSDNGLLISCDCMPGYGGPRCEFCAAGYYGNPEITGDYCKPCNCFGNIIAEDPGSCDSYNGDCLKCVNHTAGAACNLCAPGFFGDAIFSKNCTACVCDEYGMDRCDPATGLCRCRPGVVGEKCDRCETDHWGLTSGQGCTPCACGLAADSTQCDDNNGQCRCAKGVTGRHCDQCAAGYWNYTKEGCDHCNCNSGYSVGFMCNATGQCECLPGVIGEKCDRCPERWVLLPNVGCQECDSCTDALITSVETLRDQLANETRDFTDKADSFFTRQRLNYISNQTNVLRPKVADLKNVDLGDVTNAVQGVEGHAKTLLRSAEFAATDSDKQIACAGILAGSSQQVLESVRLNTQKARDLVGHVGDLATGLELSQQPKVDSALEEARQIKSDIADKSLEPKKVLAIASLTNATEQQEAMGLFVQPVTLQSEKFKELVSKNQLLKNKLKDMKNFTEQAQDTVAAAQKLNANNKASKFGTKVNSVSEQNKQALEDLVDSAYAITNATSFYLKAQNTLKNASTALEGSNEANSAMEGRIAKLAEEIPELKNLADQSQHHGSLLGERAESLRALAERENNNTRTQHAYSAASAYTGIVQEIAEARQAAHLAKDMLQNVTAVNAVLKERVGPATERSSAGRELAASALNLAEGRLRPNLTRAEKALEDARNMLASADAEAIRQQLVPIAPSSLEDEIEKAGRVNAKVKETLDTMSELGSQLANSKEFALSLPKVADDTQKMSSNVRSYLQNMAERRQQILATYQTVKTQQEELERLRRDADGRLQQVKDLIEQARQVANHIQVGVTFNSSSILQPRLPDTVDEMSTSTHVSAYFRTKEKNGLILYLGNPKDTNLRRTKSDDFMVVELQNGYLHLVMDIGDGASSGRGPARIGSDVFVADDRWYQVIVDRVGRNVKLSIRESVTNGSDAVHSKEAVLPGHHTIFNLDRQKSRLYVGGAPSDALPRLQGVSYPAFDGKIEELMIGDTPVGLWNFVSAANLKGVNQRGNLTNAQSERPEYRFNGRGHVSIEARQYLQLDTNKVLLFFKTYAPDGLIYLVGDSTHFFAIQMQDGHVYLQVSLGNPNDLIIIGTKKTYNDGKWHKLDAARVLKKCSLHLDFDPPERKEFSSGDDYITSLDTMHFGGNNKGIIQVADKGFDGCLRQISIGRDTIDLSQNRESVGVAYGCQFASLVSLSGQDSYLRYVDVSTENLQLTLKFKTSQPDGLLFVYQSRTQTANNQDSISLSLKDGKLVLMSQREQLDTGISTYNDSQWHVVTVTHSELALGIVVDDYDHFSTDTPPARLNILEGVLFLGGVQPGYVLGGKVGTRAPFVGCIADATFNGRVLSLLAPYANHSVTFGRCGDTTTTGGMSPDQVQWPTPVNPDVLPTAAVNVDERGADVDGDDESEEASRGRGDSDAAPPTPAPTPAPAPTPPTPTPRRPKRPPPKKEEGCALAYDPHYVVGDPEEGYRFGTRNDSRIEYARLPGRQHDGFDLTITFRTNDKHGGLMFYAAAEKSPGQFLAVYMKDGKLTLAYNCGAETYRVTSERSYNGIDWHTLMVIRNEGRGKLSVDNENVGEALGSCAAPAALAAPFYYGGLRHYANQTRENLQEFYQPFKGCLKGLKMNDMVVTEVMKRVNSLQCLDNVDDGVYFGPSVNNRTNYLRLLEAFKVGLGLTVSIEIKPRSSRGLLFSAHGRKDFMIIELMDNEVVVNVENGKGPFRAVYRLSDKHSLCDGKWHKIQAVKSYNLVSVGVDGMYSGAIRGQSASTDTRSALFIGGHERDLTKVRGVQSTTGFSGCMRNIVINDAIITVPMHSAHGNVHVGICPAE